MNNTTIIKFSIKISNIKWGKKLVKNPSIPKNKLSLFYELHCGLPEDEALELFSDKEAMQKLIKDFRRTLIDTSGFYIESCSGDIIA